MTRLWLAIALTIASVLACYESTAPAILTVSPATLDFTARVGGSDPPPRYLIVSRTDGASERWTLSVTGDWIGVSSASDPQVDDTLPAMVVVRAHAAGAPAGTITGSILVTAGDQAVPVSVTLTLGTTRSLAGRWVGVAQEGNVALTLTEAADGSGTVSPTPGPVTVTGSFTDPDFSLTLVSAAADSIMLVGSLSDDNTMQATLTGGPFTDIPITLYRQ